MINAGFVCSLFYVMPACLDNNVVFQLTLIFVMLSILIWSNCNCPPELCACHYCILLKRSPLPSLTSTFLPRYFYLIYKPLGSLSLHCKLNWIVSKMYGNIDKNIIICIIIINIVAEQFVFFTHLAFLLNIHYHS